FVLADVIEVPNPTIEPPPGHEAWDPPPKPVRGVTRRQYGHHPPGLIEEVEERREEEQVEVLQPHGLVHREERQAAACEPSPQKSVEIDDAGRVATFRIRYRLPAGGFVSGLRRSAHGRGMGERSS